jgi:hypothetical protein
MKARLADSEKISIARQWHSKHISVVMDNHSITGDLLEVVFSMRSMPRLYKENQSDFSVSQELPTSV